MRPVGHQHRAAQGVGVQVVRNRGQSAISQRLKRKSTLTPVSSAGRSAWRFAANRDRLRERPAPGADLEPAAAGHVVGRVGRVAAGHWQRPLQARAGAEAAAAAGTAQPTAPRQTTPGQRSAGLVARASCALNIANAANDKARDAGLVCYGIGLTTSVPFDCVPFGSFP